MSGTEKKTSARKRASTTPATTIARATRAPRVARGARGTASAGAPTHQEIERRAYEIFQRDGRHGHALEHWLQAERELLLRR